ncbi:probable glutathione peroxidase 4 [Lolium perenne]|jgi:glutathione peroxidase|uniref:probable glutathione peroxidase 4 n=1 Tax=Lolium perenne TaxID=4522 RepID=UPI0021EAD59B|nr:probable glutathione peroxidase 4 [Lolium perenne]
MGAAESVPETSLHEFTVKDCNGKEVCLETYKGKVLLVVNVASKCGFTETNYTQLTELYQKYREKDFEILAFPCNQFLRQEPGSDQQIKDFACTRFKAEYPVFQKVRVNGPDAAPLYKFLKASKPGLFGSRIKWNFTKFLVDKNGKVINRYATATTPFSFEKDIQKALEGEHIPARSGSQKAPEGENIPSRSGSQKAPEEENIPARSDSQKALEGEQK